jgi:DNA-binding FadR family transcriptional regulator
VRVAVYSRVEENVRSSLKDHKSIADVLRSFHKAEVKNSISEHWDNAQERLQKSDPLSLAQE